MLATVISVLIFIVCGLLMLVVLVQNPKGGGLATGFSGSNQMMGVRRTTDFLEKATWGLAAALLVLSVASTAAINKDQGGTQTQTTSATQSKLSNFKTKAPIQSSPLMGQPQPGQPGQPAQPGAGTPAATGAKSPN